MRYVRIAGRIYTVQPNVSPRNELAKRQMVQLRTGRGNQCFICERKGLPLEFAHLKPTGLYGMGRGRKERIGDIRKHPKSYVLLCHACHAEFDAKYGPHAMEMPHEILTSKGMVEAAA